MFKAYEVRNPSFSDMDLDVQISHGINDWVVEGKSGHFYYGRSAAEAMKIAASYDFQ